MIQLFALLRGILMGFRQAHRATEQRQPPNPEVEADVEAILAAEADRHQVKRRRPDESTDERAH